MLYNSAYIRYIIIIHYYNTFQLNKINLNKDVAVGKKLLLHTYQIRKFSMFLNFEQFIQCVVVTTVTEKHLVF